MPQFGISPLRVEKSQPTGPARGPSMPGPKRKAENLKVPKKSRGERKKGKKHY